MKIWNRDWIILALAAALVGIVSEHSFCQDPGSGGKSQVPPASKKSALKRTVHKNFSIQFPENWTTSRKDQGNTIVARSPEGPYMMVWIEDLKKDLSAEEYFQESRSALKKDPEFGGEIETGKSVIDGMEARWATYFQMIAGKKHQVLQYWVVSGRRGFNVSGASEPAQFGEFKSRFETIAQSLKIVGSAKKK